MPMLPTVGGNKERRKHISEGTDPAYAHRVDFPRTVVLDWRRVHWETRVEPRG